MTDRSSTTSGTLDKHIRAYDYHTFSYLWAGSGLLAWVMFLLVGLYVGAPLTFAMLVASVIDLTFLWLYADCRCKRLEITEDGLRHKSILKKISVPWSHVRGVKEGETPARFGGGPHSAVFTDAGRFCVLPYLEPVDAPTTFKNFFTAWPMSCYWEVTEEIGRRASSRWTPDAHGDNAANPRHRWWALFGRVLIYSFSVVTVLISIWVILRG